MCAAKKVIGFMMINTHKKMGAYIDGVDLFAKYVNQLELRSFVARPNVVVHGS